jgi:hypothetical protein
MPSSPVRGADPRLRKVTAELEARNRRLVESEGRIDTLDVVAETEYHLHVCIGRGERRLKALGKGRAGQMPVVREFCAPDALIASI